MNADELAAIKAEHWGQESEGGSRIHLCSGGFVQIMDGEEPCLPYRLADAALAEQQRADAARLDWEDADARRIAADWRADAAEARALRLERLAYDAYVRPSLIRAALDGDQPTPEQPTHHANDCDLLIRNRACNCPYGKTDPYARSADQ